MPTALVTGGAGGIGRAISTRLRRDGFQVVVADLDGKAAQALAGELGTGCRGTGLDVRDREQARLAIALAVKAGAGLDVLVNCAGIVEFSPAIDVTEESWRRVLEVNLSGTWRLCQLACPHLSERRGSIVNISSVAALGAHPNGGAYGVSKAGVSALTRTLAVEWGGRVRVNAVAPGFIDTPMNAGLRDDPERQARIRSAVPAGRVGRPEEVADAVGFLVSAAAGYITGEVLTIDGGLTVNLLR